MTKRAAFFDLDKTLVPGSSLFLLARGMYDRDFYRVRDILKFAVGQAAYRIAGAESGRSVERTRDSSLEFAKGHSQDEMRALGREIADERILPRVYPDIAQIVRQHDEAGDLTFLTTATPIEVAEIVAHGLGMTGAMGTISEVDSAGRYTGRLVGELLHGPAKAKAAAELSARHGIELRDCAAYSDSINDLPLLESVGAPHAVNPDHQLRRIARARGWPIHELRTRRRALLVGVPSALGGVGLLAGGIAIGMWIQRRRPARSRRPPVRQRRKA
jgi:HAD superfamily hydrolase (TIGR01490 family)